MLALIAHYNLVVASETQAEPDNEAHHSQTMDKATLMALLEFVGSWDKSDGEWVDPLSLEVSAPESKVLQSKAVKSRAVDSAVATEREAGTNEVRGAQDVPE